MTRRAWIVFVWAIVGTVALGLTACLISYDPDSVELQQPQDQSPRVILVSPEPNERVGDFLEVHLTVDNLTLVPKWGEENVAGEGHLQVFIDGHSITSESEGIALANFRIGVSALAASQETSHSLRIEVLQNDGTPYEGIHALQTSWIKLPRTGTPDDGNEGTGNGTGNGAE